jgi:oligopeptide/dipeptide ABC transporter ATP-binding protein
VHSTQLTERAQEPGRSPAEPLLRVEGLCVRFPIGRAGFWGQDKLFVHAVEDVSFEIAKGETLGLVGESGSGKTTTGRAVLRRVEPTAGRIFFKGEEITGATGEPLRRLRRSMQLVFQDPYASLNPRMRILDIVGEPLLVHGQVRSIEAAAERVAELLELVGLPANAMQRYPHAFSGGQRQRIGIARALQDLQERLGLTYLFIAHDLSVVRHISHRVAIMYAGKIVEIGDRHAIYEDPKHPYTQALLSAVPIPDPEVESRRHRVVLRGTPPDLIHPPGGCRFHSRCPIAVDRCSTDPPPLEEKQPAHRAACWLT